MISFKAKKSFFQGFTQKTNRRELSSNEVGKRYSRDVNQSRTD